MKKLLSLSLALIFTFNLCAQTRQILLETKNIALVLSVGNNQRVVQSYLGKKFSAAADYAKLSGGPEVYLTAGMENQFEPAIRMVHADGNPSLELLYVSHKLGDSTLSFSLKDPVYATEVILHYTFYFNEDVFSNWAEIKNAEAKPVMMTQYASSMLHFTADEYWLTQFYGDWAREVQMQEEKLTNGIKTIESKLGTRTNFYQTQTFIVSLNGSSTETSGELIAGSLAWTGNFQYTFEVDQR